VELESHVDFQASLSACQCLPTARRTLAFEYASGPGVVLVRVTKTASVGRSH
jgi:hypothetical protein